MPRDESLLGDTDLHLFAEGTHRYLYECLGAHQVGTETWFGVWAPNARSVAVIGDFDDWGCGGNRLLRQDAGVWEGAVDGVPLGARYKFRVTEADGHVSDRADPFAAQTELPPATASRVADLTYRWGDGVWMSRRGARNRLDAPISVYEVHLGSWGRTVAGSGERHPNYRELAGPLADHALAHGFTHVELLPIMEHPFYGSWGYQSTGYFAPTARYGEPVDFMAFVDELHQRGVGVILDWVPSHFPADGFAIYRFDGTHLFEHADPRQGHHPDWDSAVFNYGRNEVRSFLVSSAMCWLDRYHADGLRVDAVASMLYLDYSRKPGEWVPNQRGGRENLEAVGFVRQLNEAVYDEFPDVQTFAEESTSWPMVSRPTYAGGLGFGLKWDMGWMHDTLEYLRRDPVHRSFHHDELTFRSVYASSENYLLPLSHDEVVHGKRSLLGKMPGDEWQRFANLRLLYGYQWTLPGKKLLFMGGELAVGTEWNHEANLDWSLHDAPGHVGVRRWVADLNRLYAAEPALHRRDCVPDGFEWVEGGDADQSIVSYLRLGEPEDRPVLIVANFTPVVRPGYRVGVPVPGRWCELLNSDDGRYGGSGVMMGSDAVAGDGAVVGGDPEADGGVLASPVPMHGRDHSLGLTLPPLGITILAPGTP